MFLTKLKPVEPPWYVTRSTLCGFAWGMVPLVLFRGLQGPERVRSSRSPRRSLAISTGPKRARVQGWISGVWGVAAIIGPTLGAFLVEHLSWSLVFWINLPVGAWLSRPRAWDGSARPFCRPILSGTRPKATRSAIAVAGPLRRLATRAKQPGASKGATTSFTAPAY